MAILKGQPVMLINSVEDGKDPFGRPTYRRVESVIDNVLITPVSSQDVIDQLNLVGSKAVYVLAIPKGDTNRWENQEVLFFGQRWKVVGIPTQGLDALIPLGWNKKVTVERYE